MKRKILTMAALACAVALQGRPVLSAVIPTGVLEFTVLRDGDEIGKDVLSFRKGKDAGTLEVNVKTDIAVKMAFITVYRFTHRSREEWAHGRLVHIESTTDDDGTAHKMHADLAADGLQVNGDQKHMVAPAGIVPASLWNHDIVTSRTLLNTLTGKQMKIAVKDLGPESVKVHGRPARARHFVVSGELERELWYDHNGSLVRARFKGSDGSEIVYALR